MRVSFLICLVIGFALAFFPSGLRAQVEKGVRVRTISQRLDRLIDTVGAIEKRQQEILSQQDETIAEIKNLKIVSRH